MEYHRPKLAAHVAAPPVLLLALIVLGIVARLGLAYFFYGNYDQDSFEIVAQIATQGGNAYAETARYNYSPVWSLLLGGMYQ